MGTITWATEPHFIDERRAASDHLGRITTGTDLHPAVTINGIDYRGAITANRSPHVPGGVAWEFTSLCRTGNDGHLIPDALTDAATRQLRTDLTARFPDHVINQPLTTDEAVASARAQVIAAAHRDTADLVATCQRRLSRLDLPLSPTQIHALVLETARTALADTEAQR